LRVFIAHILSNGGVSANNCRLWFGYLLGKRRKMKKSVITYATALLVCLGLTLSARAVPIIDVNEEWGMILQPGESLTCLAHFIPAIPGIVPASLIFTQPPQWTNSYPFNYEAAGWDTALTDMNKTAYLFGPEITNSGPDPWYLFSYKLYYQWDGEGTDYDPDYPAYLDWVAFDGSTIIRNDAWRRTAGGVWEKYYDVTWREQHYPESEPYENPAPEPMTICLLGFGAAFCRKASLTGVRKSHRRSKAMATERR
jgi:hypothetical protein